jgi:hypothetical protein
MPAVQQRIYQSTAGHTYWVIELAHPCGVTTYHYHSNRLAAERGARKEGKRVAVWAPREGRKAA